MHRVTPLDIGGLIISIVLHIVDVAVDFYVAHTYLVTGKYSYFSWTLAFILIPAIIIALISIRMYVEDCKDNGNFSHAVVRVTLCILGLILQSAHLIRYCDSFWYAIKSIKAERRSDRKEQEKYHIQMLKEDSDVALLRVFEGYLESAPQQVLQTTLLLRDYSQGSVSHATYRFIMIILSFIAMGLCMANYHRCIRFDQADKKKISKLGLTVQFFWHLNFTVSRILAIAAVSVLYPLWTCLAIVCHWCLMTMWVAIHIKTNFCRNKIFEVFFSGAIGLIYIFNFLNLKEGPTKKFYSMYFLLCFSENVIATVIWAVRSTPVIENWVYCIFAILPVVSFTLSLIFLVIYYKFLHPNRYKSNIKCNEEGNKETNFYEQRVSLTDKNNC